jgi:GDPmannose 4,6-dehydratase
VQQPKPDDYVIATGEAHSVRELCEKAFGQVGLDYREFVEIDPRYYRPTEVDYLLGDPSKATKALGWKPRTSFAELVKIMMDGDMELAQRELRAGGPAAGANGSGG